MLNLESIWEQTSAKLKAFIFRRVEDEDVADDLLQEVFVRVHQNMSTLKDAEKLESWIYQITRNVIIDHYRSRRIHTELPETLADPLEIFTEDNAVAELSGSMYQMVNELPSPYREALLLTEYGGLTQKDLAQRLGISLSGAKSRVQRARQKIKDSLLNCCHFEFDRYGRVVDYWEACCCCSSQHH
jgi:RNA polymerase sigma-70 factor (ECF subfamily)